MNNYDSFEKLLLESEKALVIGIGGGGDIVGTIPTEGLLKLFNIECVLGGLAWERSVIDPVPGPRKFDEIKNCRKLHDHVWYANPSTVTEGGVMFAESGVAKVLGRETLLVDINSGPKGVAEGLVNAAEVLGADLIVGVDVGGDAISRGFEEGLASPLADSIMVAALKQIEKDIPAVLGIFGFGSDGELTFSELEQSVSEIAKNGGLLGSWGMTRSSLDTLKKLIEVVPTEASRLPVECAEGAMGERFIRSGTRKVELTPLSTMTLYFSPSVVYETVSKSARAVADCASIDEANEALHNIGLHTELDLELEKQARLSGSG